jgi:hypothetical protein
MFASAATGWSVSCRVGLLLSHWSSALFHGALKQALRKALLWMPIYVSIQNIKVRWDTILERFIMYLNL